MAATIVKTFGVGFVNADAKATASLVAQAAAKKSWFLLGVAGVLALVRIGQELGSVAYTMRTGAGAAPADDAGVKAEIDAIVDPAGAPEASF